MLQQKLWITRIKLSQQILIDRLVIHQAMHYCLPVFKMKLPEINLFVGATSNIRKSHSTFNRYLHSEFYYFSPLQPQIHVELMFLFEKNEICTITASPNGTATMAFSEKLFLSSNRTGTRSMWLFFKAEDNKTHWCNFNTPVAVLMLWLWGSRSVRQLYASKGRNLLFTRTLFPPLLAAV